MPDAIHLPEYGRSENDASSTTDETREGHRPPRDYGRREDQINSLDFDEEAQPLHHEVNDDTDGIEPIRQISSSHFTRFGAVISWIKGPKPSKPLIITPIFPTLQAIPGQILDRFIPTSYRPFAFIIFILIWLLAFSIPLIFAKSPSTITNLSITPETTLQTHHLTCTDTFFRRTNLCGLNGLDCAPFSETSLAFTCPANCAAVQVLNPRFVGANEVVYRSFVIGDGIYRGDSFICGAAIHAGIISDESGGCGIVETIGSHGIFNSSTRNGIESVEFDSTFPLSFTFSSPSTLDTSTCDNKLHNFRPKMLMINMLFTILSSLFTTSPIPFFTSAFTALFAHVSFVSDPPGTSYRSTSPLPDLFSTFTRRFLPACFCATVIYRFSVQRSLTGLARSSPWDQTLLWLGPAWLGTLSNYTFDRLIPIQRLRIHDIKSQPGGPLALLIIIGILVSIVIQQIRNFQLEGRLPRYLGIYGSLVLSLLTLIFLTTITPLELRIHHYILALLLLPGTNMQTRTALIYQGLLLGLFINGTARWGFDAVVQSSRELSVGEKMMSQVPVVLQAEVTGSEIVVKWDWNLDDQDGLQDGDDMGTMKGISILINDVERYRAFYDSHSSNSSSTTTSPNTNDDDFTMTESNEFKWTRPGEDVGLPEYFRFAYMSPDGGGAALDYSEAGIWGGDGVWVGTEQS